MCTYTYASTFDMYEPAVYVAIISTRMYGRRHKRELESRREVDNDFDRYAVPVLRRGIVVGHLPQFPLSQGSTYVMALLDLLVDSLELLCR